MKPTPQFTAALRFHFREHGPNRWHKFIFGPDLHRRVPMQMEGIEGLHTVGMWVKEQGTFKAGDTAVVECVVIWPEAFSPIVKPGVRFQLWDAGFLADGTVLERINEGWLNEA